MFKRPHYIAFGLVGLLTLIVLTLPNNTANQIKLAVGSLFLPFFGLAKSSHQLAAQAGEAVTPRAELVRQNEQLRRTNQWLELRAMQADALRHENDGLRQQLHWQARAAWKLKLASVVARDPANWWLTIQIDLGSRDGVKTNAPVLTPEGLVGRVYAVGPASSQVMLLGNPNCRVSAMSEIGGAAGIIVGAASPLENSILTMSYLSSENNLKPGQMIVTSDAGGTFPKGVVIGQAFEAPHPVEFGLYSEVRVKLAVDLGALEEVWVLMP